jgi:putative transposase
MSERDGSKRHKSVTIPAHGVPAAALRGYRRLMPRRPRNLLPPSGFYHVTARGVARAAIAPDDEDRLRFLTLLANVTRREGWRCHTFCLMPNHYHLILRTTLERLSRGFQRLNGIYAREFNEWHGRSGHLFGRRFASFVIRDDDHLRTASEYVLQNPVRAGLCDDADDWRWSGTGSRATILRARAAAG